MCSISVIFSTYKFEPVGVFDDFYIKNEHRKKGCAGKLVNYAFNDMRSKGVNSVLVGCSKADTGMYRHLGFNTELGNLLGWDGEAIPGK
jgi:predicted GNAT family acetyltransferase